MTVKGKRNVTLERDASPIPPRAEDTSRNHAPSQEEIRRRAYEIYLERDGVQAMSLMIGTGLNANSKRSLCSPKTGIVFRTGLPRVRKPKLTISATRKRLKGQSDDDADDFRKGSRVKKHETKRL